MEMLLKKEIGTAKVIPHGIPLRYRLASGPEGLRPGGEIKGFRGDVQVVRRTRNPADLSASGGLTQLVKP